MALSTGKFPGMEVAVQDHGIAVITFNRPDQMNGMLDIIERHIAEIMTQAQLDDSIRCVVITGTGRAFSAGADITGRTPDFGDAKFLVPDLDNKRSGYAYWTALSHQMVLSIRRIDKPTVAAVNGLAIQSGLSIALCCDFRIASTEARFGSATLRFGFQPDEGGHYPLVQLIGISKTLDFLLRKKIVSAQEALDMGMVNEVVAPDQLMPRAMELAQELAAGPRIATGLLKRAIYNAWDLTFQYALEDIASKAGISDLNREDIEEGRNAFREKRAPNFTR